MLPVAAAKRFKVFADGRERLRLQMWAAARREPTILKRWAPSPRQTPKTGKRIASVKQAVSAAQRAETEAALDFLLSRARKGDSGASAAAIQLLAFRGRWRELVPLALTVITKTPIAAAEHATFGGACALLRRAEEELDDRSILDDATSKLPPAFADEGARNLRGEVRDRKASPAADSRAKYDAFASLPREAALPTHARAASLLVYTHLHLGLEDEQIALWDPANAELRFREALWVADIWARRGEAEKAWAALSSRLPTWWPFTIWDVAPIELLTDREHEPQGRLLGQCRRRELLRDDAS